MGRAIQFGILLALITPLLLQGAAARPAAVRTAAVAEPATGDAPVLSVSPGTEERKNPRKDRGKGKGKGEGKGKKDEKPRCFGKRPTIADRTGEIGGTLQNDVVIGNDSGNLVESTAGVDRVCTEGGNDRIDYREIDDGRRVLANGGKGVDTLLGTDGDDQLFGGDGNDDVGGFLGRNLMVGGDGDDFMASSGPDRIFGGKGADTINADNEFAGDGPDIIDSGRGNDTIRAADDRGDVVACGPGTDTVDFDPGLDELSGCEIQNPA